MQQAINECLMLLLNKYKYDGTLERRKDKLKGQGCSIHFIETFAPVARFGSIHLLIALPAKLNMKVHQVCAYQNGEFNKTIYMEISTQSKGDLYNYNWKWNQGWHRMSIINILNAQLSPKRLERKMNSFLGKVQHEKTPMDVNVKLL